MGHKQDQNIYSGTYRPTDTQGPPFPPRPSGNAPPPLPPRAISTAVTATFDAPPPYSETAPSYHSQPLTHSWSSQDPRSSSTDSLVPHQSTEGNGKRTLLLVYIHGFMGNETSFQSFPAHVHNAATVRLKETHDVHTKIYPKYKSRKAIEFARDDFSNWLRPHESPDTDVILLGHSMGGILSAEVTLLKPESTSHTRIFSHRILGTINFDTPFLGMHPGVITSGIGSLFKPAPNSPAPNRQDQETSSQDQRPMLTTQATQSSVSSSYFGSDASSTTLNPTAASSTTMSSPLSLPTKDPHYDPPFANDVRAPTRTGWSNAWHFINKHSDGLAQATKSYLASHLEFGGCMADYKGLQNRYAEIRALEDVNSERETRIRFINYYTASNGRPKKRKLVQAQTAQQQQLDGTESPVEMTMRNPSLEASIDGSAPISPRISVEKSKYSGATVDEPPKHNEHLLGVDDDLAEDDAATSDASEAMNHLSPAPIIDSEHEDEPADPDSVPDPILLQSTQSAVSNNSERSQPIEFITSKPPSIQKVPTLPPILSVPEEPPTFDPSPYMDKDTRKLAEKEHSRQLKAYKQAVKDRENAIKERRKLLEKREKKAAKDRDKLVKQEEKERVKAELKEGKEEKEKEKEKKKSAEPLLEQEQVDGTTSATRTASKTSSAEEKADEEKSKKDKKFCMLPPQTNNQPDPCWVRVFMPGVDEVGAHCGLFFVDGQRYEWFVGDVAVRIEGWVHET